ncbi:hypothetical protein [Streptomyces soliscabiei]|nr:hypothetical protein [Streptomyces sp. NY05-11A]MDX2676839.1 hypothetical protein [Streptomyces sp. NY05-11A]
MNPAQTEGEPPRTPAVQNDTELNGAFGRCSRGWASSLLVWECEVGQDG